MSIEIDINVNRAVLLTQNRQQTTANRFSKLEADQNAALAKTGAQEYDAQQAELGTRTDKATDGNAYSVKPIDRKVGAKRKNTKRIYFGPKYAPFYGQTVTAPAYSRTPVYFLCDTLNSRGGAGSDQALKASRLYYLGYSYVNGDLTGTVELQENAGPGGKNVLHLYSNKGDSINTYIQPPLPEPADYYVGGTAITFECFVAASTTNNTGSLTFIDDNFELSLRSDGSSYFSWTGSTHHAINYLYQSLNDWTHIAVVFFAGQFKVFAGGTLLGTFETGLDYAVFSAPEINALASTATYEYTDVNFFLSSLRIVPKALYSQTFTPPTSIL